MSHALCPLKTTLIADLGVPAQLFMEVANADERDVSDAVEAAVRAQESWAYIATTQARSL